ncbi:hypothetical protein EYF80_060602 [Liparis tanakae]|uniref:Uncharacterized protein n=1 Tax=Liparis tanakae TaxID=230148 RepID=A0A4Z2EKZ5_9TELE|nr:hypothetical protein EYF80_060602 [Liparis tanakae]
MPVAFLHSSPVEGGGISKDDSTSRALQPPGPSSYRGLERIQLALGERRSPRWTESSQSQPGGARHIK